MKTVIVNRKFLQTRVLKQPTLLGVFELADVRSVVKQWIASTDGKKSHNGYLCVGFYFLCLLL